MKILQFKQVRVVIIFTAIIVVTNAKKDALEISYNIQFLISNKINFITLASFSQPSY